MSAAKHAAQAPEEPQDKVIHEVDGIEEYDNKLPNWWLYTLYGAILFACVYWFHYHIGKFGDLPTVEYQHEVERANAEMASKAKTSSAITPEALLAMAKDKTSVEQGKQVFTTMCAACHRADGGGVVGPNLTDEFWLHGGAPEKIYKAIAEGVPDKGMAAWLPQLGPDRVRAVTAYVVTLRGTSVPGGKAPQGEREELLLR